MWMAAGVVGAAYSLYLTLISVRARRLGVDVIALLALVGAMAVGEYLAAALKAVGSVEIGLAATFAGVALGRLLG